VLVVGAVLSPERIVAAHVFRHLHLDNVSTPVRQLAAGRGARAHLSEIDDAKTLQGGGSRPVWHIDPKKEAFSVRFCANAPTIGNGWAGH
jgi:hypothetical protein